MGRRHRFGMRQQLYRRLRRLETTPRSQEQSDPEPIFKSVDMPASRRLSETKPARSAREAATARDFEKRSVMIPSGHQPCHTFSYIIR